MGHLSSTWVVKWSHVVFDQPVPLIPRREVQVGDVVMSSHGIALRVGEVGVHRVDGRVTQVRLRGGHRTGGRQFHTEQQDGGSIPLLERNGVVFGNPTYEQDKWGDLIGVVPEAGDPHTSGAGVEVHDGWEEWREAPDYGVAAGAATP